MSSRTAPFLALAELRLRLVVRRLLGKGGVPELVARTVMLGLAVPVGLLFAWFTGSGAFLAVRTHSPRAMALGTALFFFGIWTSWTAVALTLADRESFDLRRILVYPVPPWQAYAYELAAGLIADPFAVFWLLLQLGAFVGATVARPGGWVLLLGVTHLLFAAGTVCLVALLQELLARALSRRRVRELGVAAVYVATLLLAVYGAAGGLGALWTGLRSLEALRWLAFPAAFAIEAAVALYGRDLAGALPWLGALAAAIPAAAWAAYRLALSDARAGAEGARSAGGAGGGWRLPGRLGPILEKELKYLLRHPLTAVLALVLPALAAVVGWKALPLLPQHEIWRALPLFGFALYTLLVTQAVWLNAFGWDRGGARLWFLAPVAPGDVLRAKNGASAILAFVLFALCAIALAATGGAPEPWAVCGALALHLGAGTWWTAAGNFVSILNPRPGSHSLQRGASLAPMTALAGMAIVSGGTTLFGLPVLLARRSENPWLLVAIWTALAAAGVGVRRAVLPSAARLLARRREHVLAAVAGDDA